jgi:hypothetical protein
VGDGAQFFDGLGAHGIEHPILKGIRSEGGAARGLRASGGGVEAVRRGSVEVGAGIEVVHGLEREAVEREEEAHGVDGDGVADHEVAQLLLEAHHGELDGNADPRDAGAAAREVVDGDVQSGEILRDVVLRS